MYCEIDANAQAILNARMDEAALPRAPICNDVAELSKQGLPNGTVDLITAGFPCQGFSLLGHRTGYAHDASSLYKHVVRLVGEIRPALVFLENVPDILCLGMDAIVETLCNEHMYDLRWMVLGAHQLGAPHARRGWFCLGIRSDDAARAVVQKILQNWSCEDSVYPWRSNNAPPVMTLAHNRSRRLRCAALGNAVVPDCVRHAFHRLLQTPVETKPWIAHRRKWPQHGGCRPSSPGAEIHSWTPTFPVVESEDMRLSFDPHTYTTDKTRSKLQTLTVLTDPVAARRWTTPRHGNVTAANVLTARTLRDLPSQVRFERNTPNELRRGQISAEFVEYLMGYPIGWTSS